MSDIPLLPAPAVAAPPAFDFATHANNAGRQYLSMRPAYDSLASTVRTLIDHILVQEGVKPASIEARAKSVDSFVAKVSQASEEDPNLPKYPNPDTDITDFAGVRIIVFLLDDVKRVQSVIQREFEIVEEIDKIDMLKSRDTLGYRSIHFLVKLKSPRIGLPEYVQYDDKIVEIQLRTVLQHAWAEIEHDIQYKALASATDDVRRRFLALAGLIEIADREFQAIQQEDARVQAESVESVERKEFTIELSAPALKQYLDQTEGRDERVSFYSYVSEASLLRSLGFRRFSEIDDCVTGYDGDRIARIVWGNRQGPIWRFRVKIVLGMGTVYEQRVGSSGFTKRVREAAERLGYQSKDYDPRSVAPPPG